MIYRLLLILIVATISALNTYGSVTKYTNTPPSKAHWLKGYTEESAMQYLKSAPIDILEGIWDFPLLESKVCIERFYNELYSSRFRYRIVVISSINKSIIPGTIVGYIMNNGSNDEFYLWLYSLSNSAFVDPQQYIGKTDNGKLSISITPAQRDKRIRGNAQIPEKLIRIYPETGTYNSGSTAPRYL